MTLKRKHGWTEYREVRGLLKCKLVNPYQTPMRTSSGHAKNVPQPLTWVRCSPLFKPEEAKR